MRVQTLGGTNPTYIDVPVDEILNVARPQFPLAPACRYCGWRPRPEHQRTVMANNRNGNAGRKYYICFPCRYRGRSQRPWDHYGGWITWDDDRGIYHSNPRCYCGAPSRQDRAGLDTSIPGLGFWTCATGSCDYFSRFWNGWTDDQKEESTVPNPGCVEFTPWLL